MHKEEKESDLKALINCRKIHEPCFPYFSSVYMTLLSVMQGIVFASVIMPTVYFAEKLDYNALLCFSVLIFSIVLWHKYVNHHQILGWQLGPFDTINIAFFGLLQTIMFLKATDNHQLSINGNYIFNSIDFTEQTIWILFIIFISILLGVISYAHSGSEACKDYIENVIIEHV